LTSCVPPLLITPVGREWGREFREAPFRE